MSFVEMLLIGTGLATDACAVSLGKGLAAGRVGVRLCVQAGLYFGCFQAAMPMVGYVLGRTFAAQIGALGHWVAFGLLVLIGANMLRSSFGRRSQSVGASFAPGTMLPLAMATSIDALAVGVSFSFALDRAQALLAVGTAGAVTFLLSAAALKIGSVFGTRHEVAAARIGGCLLILMGIKLLLDGLGCHLL